MKLAAIILPTHDNDHKDLFFTHEQLKHDLLSRWGGYGFTSVYGSWRHPGDGKVYSEASVKYEIAMERADVVHLRTLAAALCRQAKQEAIMIVTPNGDVEFIHEPR